MTKPRVPETDSGIQGEFIVDQYDRMQRKLRDRGWIETEEVLQSGITNGHALEVGHGPGYLGLEWLKATSGTSLTGLDISPDMKALAERNAAEYGLSARVDYRLGNAASLPFEDGAFDAVFTNGSLHEWEEPLSVLDEIWRVLKPGGRFCVSDLRRDMNGLLRTLMWLSTQPAAIRPGLTTSINAAYIPAELEVLLKQTCIEGARVSSNLMGITITGEK
jgi:ubiquinone/menaquinone biosynthesis C-methylase UbiE